LKALGNQLRRVLAFGFIEDVLPVRTGGGGGNEQGCRDFF